MQLGSGIHVSNEMATKRVCLPALKVTRRPAHSKKSVSYFRRKASGLAIVRKSERQSGHGGLVETSSLEDCQFSPSSASQEPTGHEIDSKAVITGWEKIRHKIRTAVTESAALPILQACLLCEASATMRCKQCGPKGYYCLECFLTSHSSVNIFHVAEIWKVRKKSYTPFPVKTFYQTAPCELALCFSFAA